MANDCRRLQQVFRSEEHTSELQSRRDLVCRLLLEKKKTLGVGHREVQPGAHDELQVVVVVQRPPGPRLYFFFFSCGDHREDFFFNETATTEIYTLSLHDALPI